MDCLTNNNGNKRIAFNHTSNHILYTTVSILTNHASWTILKVLIFFNFRNKTSLEKVVIKDINKQEKNDTEKPKQVGTKKREKNDTEKPKQVGKNDDTEKRKQVDTMKKEKNDTIFNFRNKTSLEKVVIKDINKQDKNDTEKLKQVDTIKQEKNDTKQDETMKTGKYNTDKQKQDGSILFWRIFVKP
jgi:hypothetical protein